MKGVSTVIATILLLMITIALVTMATGFIFGWWGRITQGIEKVSEECIEGATDTAKIKIRNIGDKKQTVDVEQTAPSGAPIGTTYFDIEPGQVVEYTDTCEGVGTRYCVYRFTPRVGGFPITAQVGCS